MKFINNLRNLLSLDRMQQQRQLRLCERMIDEAENCSSFKELLACHQHIFSEGIHIPNLDYQPTGMFRAAAAQLTLEKVYLGNICGLFIKNARYWESSKDYIARDVCLRQWENELIANLTDYFRSITQTR